MKRYLLIFISHASSRNGKIKELKKTMRLRWIGRNSLMGYPNCRISLVNKKVSRMCRVGKMMKLWKKQEMDKCPWCGEKETAEHILECKEESVIQQF